MLLFAASAFAAPDTPRSIRSDVFTRVQGCQHDGCLAEFEAACSPTDPVSCAALAFTLEGGSRADRVRAGAVLADLCRTTAAMCDRAAGALPKEAVVERRGLLDKGCEGGDTFVCFEAAHAWLKGADVDPARAFARTDLACDRNEWGACFETAEARIVFGTAEDAREGQQRLLALAEAGDSRAIWALVHMVWGGTAAAPVEVQTNLATCPVGDAFVRKAPSSCTRVTAALREVLR